MERMQSDITNIRSALHHVTKQRGRLVAAIGVAFVTYVLYMLSTFPEYAIQMVQHGASFLEPAVAALSWNFVQGAGILGLGLVAVYALLTGVAAVNMATLIKMHGLSSLVAGSSSITPAFLVGGCAGCGAGLLGFFGFVGAASLLPFNGNGVRVIGILLILFFLAKTGDPETCAV